MEAKSLAAFSKAAAVQQSTQSALSPLICLNIEASLRITRLVNMSHPQSVFDNTSFFGETILSRRRDIIAGITLHAQLEQLKQTGRYDCFKLKWHPIYDDKSMWPVPYHLFWDSDVAKWIESACYFLQREYDAGIDLAVRELVDMIRGAQQPDGYINMHYTVVEPQKRWSNLRDMHELLVLSI